MRFRGVIIEPDLMASVLSTMDRISSDFFLVMSPTHWQFRLNTSYTGDDRVYAEFQVVSAGTPIFYNQYFLWRWFLSRFHPKSLIESRADNLIPFIGSLTSLCRALKSARGAHQVRIILDCKDGQALLCFQISKDRGQPCLYQKIPVTIRPPISIQEGAEPLLEKHHVRIRMPNLRALSRIVDRMKTIDDHLIIQANTDGEAIFSVRNDMAYIRTMYRDLKFHPKNPNSQLHESVSATCSIAAKCFSKMLTCCSLDPAVVVGCIAEDQWFVVYLELGDRLGTITYYIPLIEDH